MPTGTEAGAPEPEGLQFDRAEFEQAAPEAISCAACKRPIEERYYEINGTVFCQPCREAIGARLGGGSGFVGLLRALAFGIGAAAVGTLIYTVFIYASNSDFALISILVGYLVGKAVRAGSWNRGGLLYQGLAVALTYLAIGVTYTSVRFLHLKLANDPFLANQPLDLIADFIISSVIAPVMEAQRSVISIAIIGFALWQAWKMNVRLKLVVTGPYLVGDPGAEGPIGEAGSYA
jgi:hypothetical protein